MGQDGNDANSSSDKNNNNSGSWRHFLWSWQDEGGAGVRLTFLAWGPCTEKQALFARGRGRSAAARRDRKVEAEVGEFPKTETKVNIGYGIFYAVGTKRKGCNKDFTRVSGVFSSVDRNHGLTSSTLVSPLSLCLGEEWAFE